jgi:MFS family permease
MLLALGIESLCEFVAGSSLLTDRLQAHERAPIQGTADLVVGAASVVGSLSSGELMASVGYQSAATIGMGVALVVLAVAIARYQSAPKLDEPLAESQ